MIRSQRSRSETIKHVPGMCAFGVGAKKRSSDAITLPDITSERSGAFVGCRSENSQQRHENYILQTRRSAEYRCPQSSGLSRGLANFGT